MIFVDGQVPELPIYETVRKIPTGRMARISQGPGHDWCWVAPVFFLQDGAENMEKYPLVMTNIAMENHHF